MSLTKRDRRKPFINPNTKLKQSVK